jgi:ankyrin repeat protein
MFHPNQQKEHLCIITALQAALINEHINCVLLLLDMGTQIDSAVNFPMHVMHLLAMKGNLAAIKKIIEVTDSEVLPELLNVRDLYEQTPLIFAAKNGYQALVDYLIAFEKIDLHATTQIPDGDGITEKNNYTALDWATEAGHYEISKILKEKGAPAFFYNVNQSYESNHREEEDPSHRSRL